jgi:hypothetical protein
MPLPIPSYAEIIDLLKKGATIEAQEKIMALREAVLTLQEENLALRTELKALKEASTLDEIIHFNGKVYQISGHGKRDGHYCPACFDKDHKPVRLQFDDTYFSCPVCTFAVAAR